MWGLNTGSALLTSRCSLCAPSDPSRHPSALNPWIPFRREFRKVRELLFKAQESVKRGVHRYGADYQKVAGESRMLKNDETREQLFEDFKRLLEGDTFEGEEKVALVLQYLDAIIHAPARVIH